MKPIGIFKVWNHTIRDNLPVIKYRRFGQRSFKVHCDSWRELEKRLIQLRRQGFVSI